MKESAHSDPASPKRWDNVVLSVVVPVYNETEVLEEFHRRLCRTLEPLPLNVEVIYVNDGSTDCTLQHLKSLKECDPRIAILDLSRNFGKEIALTAGLDNARGDAVVIIDADLQDPPELILEMLTYWQQGYDVVYAKRLARDGESILKKSTAYLFYRFIQKVSRVSIPSDTGDYRLLSRRAVEAVNRFREHHRFMKGIFAWIGYPQREIRYTRAPRYAGNTKWNYWRLWNFALEGITSFTIAPLKVATYLGLGIAIAAFVYAGIIVVQTFVYGNRLPGYPSLMVTMLFLGGVQLITIGIIGEYLGRMFDETKKRPLYLVKNYDPPASVGLVEIPQSQARIPLRQQSSVAS